MIKISQDKEFHCHTCIHSTARCNRMALEINTEWNDYNKPYNHMAKTDDTIYVGPKDKSLGKHVYKDESKRWNQNLIKNLSREPNSPKIYQNNKTK